ncbi:unnamed protein product [Lactuca saligna]|uniref:Uncharacterized protein n=1 Tax=Lactuca saligna TaxID=75948 RepID=A0AA36DWC6_LACSI|nr:unnamed protein product [Lactuca saligna]
MPMWMVDVLIMLTFSLLPPLLLPHVGLTPLFFNCSSSVLLVIHGSSSSPDDLNHRRLSPSTNIQSVNQLPLKSDLVRDGNEMGLGRALVIPSPSPNMKVDPITDSIPNGWECGCTKEKTTCCFSNERKNISEVQNQAIMYGRSYQLHGCFHQWQHDD